MLFSIHKKSDQPTETPSKVDFGYSEENHVQETDLDHLGSASGASQSFFSKLNLGQNRKFTINSTNDKLGCHSKDFMPHKVKGPYNSAAGNPTGSTDASGIQGQTQEIVQGIATVVEEPIKLPRLYS